MNFVRDMKNGLLKNWRKQTFDACEKYELLVGTRLSLLNFLYLHIVCALFYRCSALQILYFIGTLFFPIFASGREVFDVKKA